ncbi:hypothetical protein OAM67_00985 [bacterium]|nr:hypothetical protein [bacterium]
MSRAQDKAGYKIQTMCRSISHKASQELQKPKWTAKERLLLEYVRSTCRHAGDRQLHVYYGR